MGRRSTGGCGTGLDPVILTAILAGLRIGLRARFIREKRHLGIKIVGERQRVRYVRASDGCTVRFYRPQTPWVHRSGGCAYYRAHISAGVVAVVLVPDGRYLVVEPHSDRASIYVPADVDAPERISRRAA